MDANRLSTPPDNGPRFFATTPTPWAETCCRHNYNLLIGNSQIHSQRAVQQGDLFGLFFAFAIHPCIIEAAQVTESQHLEAAIFNAFFLDDGVIGGFAKTVQLFLATLERLFHDIGLEVASNKTEVVPPCTKVQN